MSDFPEDIDHDEVVAFLRIKAPHLEQYLSMLAVSLVRQWTDAVNALPAGASDEDVERIMDSTTKNFLEGLPKKSPDISGNIFDIHLS